MRRSFRLPAFGTILRVAAATVLLAVAVSVYGPRLVEQRSREAVINARLELVRAPVPGRVVQALPPPGTPVASGTVLAVVEDPRVSAEPLARLEAELATARAELAATGETLNRLQALQQRLEARAERFARAVLASETLRRRALEERIVAARAAVAERRAHLERVRRLRRDRAVAEEEVQRAERELVEAEARLRELRLELERARTRLQALAAGVQLDRGGADVPYTRQRLDGLLATLAEWRTRRARLVARVEALARAVARERRRFQARTRVAVRSPLTGVVWRRDVAAGSHVPRAAPLGALVDCGDLLVTAILHQRTLTALTPGLPARIRPFGESRWLAGRVLAVRAAPVGEEDGFAVGLRPLEEEEAVVLVALEDQAPARDPTRFCDIGRSVELAIDGGSWLSALWQGWRRTEAPTTAATDPAPSPVAVGRLPGNDLRGATDRHAVSGPAPSTAVDTAQSKGPPAPSPHSAPATGGSPSPVASTSRPESSTLRPSVPTNTAADRRPTLSRLGADETSPMPPARLAPRGLAGERSGTVPDAPSRRAVGIWAPIPRILGLDREKVAVNPAVPARAPRAHEGVGTVPISPGGGP